VQARGLRIELPHPTFGSVPGVANPIRLSASPVQYRLAPPLLDEHAQGILDDWLGRFSTAEDL